VRRGVGWVAAVLGICVMAISLAAHFGSLWWVLDLAANFRPQMAALLLGFGLVALLGDRRVAAAVLVVGLVDAAVVVPYLVGGGAGPTGDDRIEVLTFNVGVSNPNRADVAAFIAAEDPDVVFIFESSFEWEDTIRASDLPLQIVAVVPRGRIAGVTVLVRPSLRPGAVDVNLGGEAAAVTVDLGDQRVDVLGIHPVSPTTAARSQRRDEMMAAAAGWVQARSGEVIVVGDMNASPWSHAFRNLRRRGGLVDTMRGAGLQPSWPDGWGLLAIPIDHVLYTTGLASADRRTGPAFGSAHRPVIVSIGWAG
jgi:endonuclease/exonuclease/phosphatase (EEP) superfamily protein YafD